MSNSIIEVNNLSKSYTITHEGRERYTALRDVMAQKAKKIFSFPKSLSVSGSTTKEEFWALKDVSFTIEQGDRVGIIGRNGAGKSTLLKILSRITEPTSGEIKIKGRVASLLEVGTGFHPELSGRENIFLNGAILGMSRAEIKKHFDAIVDFSGVEKFLDTPVKRYSSGMYVRLAFAVAAHLEPEILIIDEVLAVGDAEFQKKCLGKMEEVSKNEGRTVLFVSHNLTAIRNLCNKGIFLAEGQVAFYGTINQTIEQYKISIDKKTGLNYRAEENSISEKHITRASLKLEGVQPNILLQLNLGLNVKKNYTDSILVVDIINSDSVCVFQSICSLKIVVGITAEIEQITAEIELFGIVIDSYAVNIDLCTSLFQNIDSVTEELFFDIIDSPIKEKLSFDYKGTGNGYVYPITRIRID
jgi:lipopolysaccharide transport system ATP-binding protein